MSYAQLFTQHFDRLVRLCAIAPESLAEHQAALEAARASVLEGEVTVNADQFPPMVNGVPVTGAAAGLDGLPARLRHCGFGRLFVARDAEASELMLLARTIAGQPTGQAPGAEMMLRTVRVSPPSEQVGLMGQLTPTGIWAVPQPADFRPYEPSPREPTPTSSVPIIEDEQVVGLESGPKLMAPSGISPMINTPVLLRPVLSDDKRDLTADQLADRLETAHRLQHPPERLREVGLLVEELMRRAERTLREDDPVTLRDMVLLILQRGDDEREQELRLVYQMARRKLLAPTYLRSVARLAPRLPDERDSLLFILGHAGEEGADAVIEQLIAAESPSDRRAYFNTLIRLQAGEASLLHMLSDERWYVVRNAADLLGEMGVVHAEDALLEALQHYDERVRKSVLMALARLATPRGLHAVREALEAEEPTTRAHAAAALSATSWPYIASTLRRRLRDEPEPEVQQVLLAALGRDASDEAVAALIEIAAPPRLLALRRRRNPLRTAAVHALVTAATAAARTALVRLSDDRDEEVRDAAKAALRRFAVAERQS